MIESKGKNDRFHDGLLLAASTTTTTAAPSKFESLALLETHFPIFGLFILIVPARVPICQTAVWNQTFSIVSGSTSNCASTSTLLCNPYDLDFDGYRNMYVVDYSNHRIQRFAPGKLLFIRRELEYPSVQLFDRILFCRHGSWCYW